MERSKPRPRELKIDYAPPPEIACVIEALSALVSEGKTTPEIAKAALGALGVSIDHRLMRRDKHP